jgi:hypothetical protein
MSRVRRARSERTQHMGTSPRQKRKQDFRFSVCQPPDADAYTGNGVASRRSPRRPGYTCANDFTLIQYHVLVTLRARFANGRTAEVHARTSSLFVTQNDTVQRSCAPSRMCYFTQAAHSLSHLEI